MQRWNVFAAAHECVGTVVAATLAEAEAAALLAYGPRAGGGEYWVTQAGRPW